jgi:hypothetical protein
MQSSMLKILQDISKRAILLNEIDITDEQLSTRWLGSPPASNEIISQAEKTLQIKLPPDYIEFLKICNGFPATHSTAVTFLPADKIDYLINVDEFLVEVWSNTGLEAGEALARSILVGGLDEEQHFLLVPPGGSSQKWRYWKFASWIPGQEEYTDLNSFLKSELTFLRELTKGLKKPKPKDVIDFSLRDYFYQQDWANALTTILEFLRRGKLYYYCGDPMNLIHLALFCVGRLGRHEELTELLGGFYDLWMQDNVIPGFIQKAQEAWRNGLDYFPGTAEVFVPQNNTQSVADIEEQVRKNVPHLLRENFARDKAEYMLYFLYSAGNSYGFLKVYEDNQQYELLHGHLRAAEVYMASNQLAQAQNALERHFRYFFDYNPLQPFQNSNLLPAMTNTFCRKIYEKMKAIG